MWRWPYALSLPRIQSHAPGRHQHRTRFTASSTHNNACHLRDPTPRRTSSRTSHSIIEQRAWQQRRRGAQPKALQRFSGAANAESPEPAHELESVENACNWRAVVASRPWCPRSTAPPTIVCGRTARTPVNREAPQASCSATQRHMQRHMQMKTEVQVAAGHVHLRASPTIRIANASEGEGGCRHGLAEPVGRGAVFEAFAESTPNTSLKHSH